MTLTGPAPQPGCPARGRHLGQRG